MASFDLRTGEMLELEDITPSINTVLELGETHFRRAHGIDPDTDWSETPWFYDTSGFVLSKEFGITSEGLVFWYDAYEIASYSEGPSRFAIPWQDLREVLTPAMQEEFFK
jgi:hypothetical protein